MTDRDYLIQGRNPILVLHVIEKRIDEKTDPTIPPIIYAIGLGFPKTGQDGKTANYLVNLVELRNWIEIDLDEDDDDVK